MSMQELLNTLERRIRTQPPLRAQDKRLFDTVLSVLREVDAQTDSADVEELQAALKTAQDVEAAASAELAKVERRCTRLTKERNDLKAHVKELQGQVKDLTELLHEYDEPPVDSGDDARVVEAVTELMEGLPWQRVDGGRIDSTGTIGSEGLPGTPGPIGPPLGDDDEVV